jgi:Domain of unknown function (DUF3416)
MAEQQIDGRRRVVIEGVSPEIDCGRFAIKRVVGETECLWRPMFLPMAMIRSHVKLCNGRT